MNEINLLLMNACVVAIAGAAVGCLVMWAAAARAYIKTREREAAYWDRPDDGGNSGDQPIDSPYTIDPQPDPSDWWKREQKETA